MGKVFGATCVADKVVSSGFSLCEALEWMLCVEVGHRRSSVGRRPVLPYEGCYVQRTYVTLQCEDSYGCELDFFHYNTLKDES